MAFFPPVCSSVSIRGLCVKSVLQAKLVAPAYHMWKHSHHLRGQTKKKKKKREKTWQGQAGGGVRGKREIENLCVCG